MFGLASMIDPNDPYFSDQWWLKSTGQVSYPHNPGARNAIVGIDICAASGWNAISNASEVIVAVIDSGINYLHPDLAPNMWKNAAEDPANGGIAGVDDDNNGYKDDIYGIGVDIQAPNPCIGTLDPQSHGSGDPFDAQTYLFPHKLASDPGGHGTAVAALLGSRGDNQAYFCGVAWHVKIMPIHGANLCYGNTDSGLLEAFVYAVERGASVINMSLPQRPYSQTLYDAFDYLNKYDVVAVYGAGNDATNLDANPPPTNRYPAHFPFENILIVGACDEDDVRASFSNFGQYSVDIFAPGVNLRMFDGCFVVRELTPPPHHQAGTSFATPLVTGAAALLRAQHPGWSAIQVVNHIRIPQNTDQSPGVSECFSAGRLNIGKTLAGTCVR